MINIINKGQLLYLPSAGERKKDSIHEVDYVEIEYEEGKPQIYIITNDFVYVDSYGNVTRNGCKKIHLNNFDIEKSIQPPKLKINK